MRSPSHQGRGWPRVSANGKLSWAPAQVPPMDIDLARAVARAFYAQEPVVEPLAGTTYPVFRLQLTDGTRFVKFADRQRITTEAAVLKRVAQDRIPVPAVEHADPDGAIVGRPFLITRSAGERTLLSCMMARDPAVPALFEEAGSILARIHAIQIPTDDRPGGVNPRDPFAVLGRLRAAGEQVVAAGLLTLVEVRAFLVLPMPDLSGEHLCHGDFHAVQCIERDGRVAAIVDWEGAWVGNSAVDLAVAHAYFDLYAPIDLTRRFLAGYATIGKVPSDDDKTSIMVRMAHTLALANLWHERGQFGNARRAADLFREYARP